MADGVALLNRLRLEGERIPKPDIVLGLDTNLIVDAKDTGLFVPHEISIDNVDVPGGWEDEIFVPYDYGYFVLLSTTRKRWTPADEPARTGRRRPGTGNCHPGSAHLDAGPGPDAVGQACLWRGSRRSLGKAIGARRDRQPWLERVLRPPLPSGEVPMVLSYTTSPAYHIIAEESERYQAAAFEEGHYMQIEVAGITTPRREQSAGAPVHGIHDRSGFQDAIPETNWMYPAGATSGPAEPGLRPHGRAIATASLQPGGGGGKPPGMGR